MVTRINGPKSALQAAQKLAETVGPMAQMAGKTAADAARLVGKNVTDAVNGTLGITGERMSKVDTAWLRMDSDANLMMIVGVWVLKPGLDRARLRARIEERLLKFSRFVQCAVEDAAGVTWVRDPDFDLDHHVKTGKLARKPKGREQEALQDFVAALAVQPLDRHRPLWQFHVIDHYQGGSAMMVRIHHCIADGIALISVMQSLVDGGSPPPVNAARGLHHTGLEGAQDWVAGHVIKPLTEFSAKAMEAAAEGAKLSLEMMQDPRHGVEKGFAGSVGMARMALHGMGDVAALALMADDSHTRLKGIPGQTKRVAWCQPIPLEEVRAVAKALNCSINDVLLSSVAGAIGQYLKSFGDKVTGQEIRAMVPVNLRPLQDAHKLGNHFGLAPLLLPIGIDNPVERVYDVRRRMGELKGSMQPLLAFGLLAVAGVLVKPAQDAMLNLFSRKTTAVMTNVPGPREKLQFCGTTIEQSLFWVPQSGTVGLGVSILSYGGGVQFGVITDAKLCPEPQKIIDQFEPEFARLSCVTLMLPWGE